MGLLLAARVTPAIRKERTQVKQWVNEVQAATQDSVKVVFIDQRCQDDQRGQEATGIGLIATKWPEATNGFVIRS